MSDFLRQLDILNPSEIICPVTIIGLGGIGSPTALELAKMGFRKMTLFDPDRVEAHNRPNQLFRKKDEADPSDEEGSGRLKVEAMKEIIGEFAEWCSVTAIAEQFEGQLPLEGIIISGLDHMEMPTGENNEERRFWGRKEVWQKIRNNINVPLYIDGRIGGEIVQVFTVRPNQWEDIETYEETLFSDTEAMELLCTAQGIIYTGFGIASFIAAQTKKWLKQESYPFSMTYNFRNGQLICE